MAKYILKRLGLSVFILAGVSFILYTLMYMLPVNFVVGKFAGQMQNGMDAEEIERLMAIYGLSDSLFVGYFKWVGNVISGNLGYSFMKEMPVSQVISDHIWVSYIVASISLLIYFPTAIVLGTKAAVKQYSAFDYASTVFVMMGISLPGFFFSGIVIKLFAVDLGWFDASLGILSNDMPADATEWMIFWDKAWHLVLPIFVVVILSIGGLMRFTRTNTLEVLNADYIRTARSKGLPENVVIYRHAFKNTAIPLATIMAGVLPGLFSGSLIIEGIFDIPGIGNVAYKALQAGDIPFVMGYNMFIAILVVVGTLLSDIMYAIVDPSVKLA